MRGAGPPKPPRFQREGSPISTEHYPDASHLTIAVVRERATATVIATGELDMASAHKLEEEVERVRSDGVRHLVIDLQRVTFLDSTGLCLLLALRRTAARDGHRLEVTPAGPRVQRIFELTKTGDLFDWRPGNGAA
jgi:anti-sigma B factor antagonist